MSAVHQVWIEVESLMDREDFSETLIRAMFEKLNLDLFKVTLKPIQEALEDADLAGATLRYSLGASWCLVP